jgi:CheY-like chemotaxis protein
MASATIGTGLELSLDLSTDLPPVSLDPRQFHQVMTNLAQKARELAGNGGRLTVVNRRVAGTEVRVKFPDAREPSYVELSLRAAPPNGAMVAGERPGTWDAAVRFVEKRRDLSLLVAHSILASHRAHLEIDAWSGPALAFRIYLPALTETETPSGPPVPVPADPGTGERTVLVVDDEDMFLQTLSFLFGRNGFNVIKARDGIEAVAQYVLHADRISLVVIDLGLPRMSGWEAFLKMKERSPRVNALVMSGHLEANLKSEILRAGAKGFLQKPFTMSEALAEVNRLLQPTTPSESAKSTGG